MSVEHKFAILGLPWVLAPAEDALGQDMHLKLFVKSLGL